MADKTTRIALAGNPNAGKTTIFNGLTGARQHVGNYPGITVDKKEGFVTVDDRTMHIIDLPGTYSLTAYSQEELVARAVLADERPQVVVDVVSAAVLERNLYLTVQLLEMGIPVVLALNMMDEARKQGIAIDSAQLAKYLHLPVVETVGRTGEGLDRLMRETAKFADERQGEWEPLRISYGQDLDPVIDDMTERIEQAAFLTDKYPARWIAIKYMEGDEEIQKIAQRIAPELAEVLSIMREKVADHCQMTLRTYPEAIIADYRYGFISSLLRKGVVEMSASDRTAFSDQMDTVLTHRIIGPVIMVLVLFAIYHITFAVGDIPTTWMGAFFSWLGDTVSKVIPEGLFQSMIVSGVIDGVGGVLSFVPLIMIIFLLISFLEDSGYMARIAYMLDRIFRIFGLHGCSVMPFIVSGGIAGGCAVPGVMAARTLRSPKEKLATILTAPFMTCGAKLPVFILLVGVFFPRSQALALFCITIGAWVIALLVAKLLRSTLIKGPATPFVMELPPYRLPTVRGMIIHTWERTWQYIKKAGTVILALSILLWAAMTFPGLSEKDKEFQESRRQQIEEQIRSAEESGASQETVAHLKETLSLLDAGYTQANLRKSVAGEVGTAIEPVSKYAGFDWRTNIALIGGIAAKEVIISTLGTAYSMSVDADDNEPLGQRIANEPDWTVWRGMALIVFIMLYSPCFVTVIAMKQEAGSWKWAAFSVVFNTVLAFGLAVGVFQLGHLFS